MNLQEYWVLTDVRGPHESKNQQTGDFYIIEMTNAQTLEKLTTYATEGLRNFENWTRCVNKDWGVYDCVHRHSKNPKLINGDSMPRLVEDMTQQEAKLFRETGTL